MLKDINDAEKVLLYRIYRGQFGDNDWCLRCAVVYGNCPMKERCWFRELIAEIVDVDAEKFPLFKGIDIPLPGGGNTKSNQREEQNTTRRRQNNEA